MENRNEEKKNKTGIHEDKRKEKKEQVLGMWQRLGGTKEWRKQRRKTQKTMKWRKGKATGRRGRRKE